MSPESAGLKGGGEESGGFWPEVRPEGGICEVSEYVRPVPLGNDNGRKVSPGSADEHPWATIIGLNVAGECRLEAMWEMENSGFIGVKNVAGECGFRN